VSQDIAKDATVFRVLARDLAAIDEHFNGLSAPSPDDERHAAGNALLAVLEALQRGRLQSDALRRLSNALLDLEQTGHPVPMLRSARLPGRPPTSAPYASFQGTVVACVHLLEIVDASISQNEAERWAARTIAKLPTLPFKTISASQIGTWRERYRGQHADLGPGREAYRRVMAFGLKAIESPTGLRKPQLRELIAASAATLPNNP
jgi:hypothetical protein